MATPVNFFKSKMYYIEFYIFCSVHCDIICNDCIILIYINKRLKRTLTHEF